MQTPRIARAQDSHAGSPQSPPLTQSGAKQPDALLSLEQMNSLSSSKPRYGSISSTAQVRSYIRYSFQGSPPFRFLLASVQEEMFSGVEFKMRKKKSQWMEVVPQKETLYDDNVKLEVRSEDGFGDWEVQVCERA